MLKFFGLLAILLYFAGMFAVPIDTPEFDERNDFVINSPNGWGYRTFKGENGLIGVLWPAETTFNLADTVIFIFLQDENSPLPSVPCNINLFTEKCTKAKFKFAKPNDNNPALSLGEKYFSGKCGRTMVLMKENVKNYNMIFVIVSAKYITKQQFADFKLVAANYEHEVEKYIRDKDEEANTNTEIEKKTVEEDDSS
jgi:hypothetical protein